MTRHQYVVLVSEDELSEAVLRRLLDHAERSFIVHTAITTRGFGGIKAGIDRFRSACKAVPHVVLTDLDQIECAPELLDTWGAVDLPDPMLFRVAVREIEAWLMADRSGLANFLNIPELRLPIQPEAERDPKQTLINAARRSRARFARELVPEPGSRRSVGPLYNAHMIRFVRNAWNVGNASLLAPSLARTVDRLKHFLK